MLKGVRFSLFQEKNANRALLILVIGEENIPAGNRRPSIIIGRFGA